MPSKYKLCSAQCACLLGNIHTAGHSSVKPAKNIFNLLTKSIQKKFNPFRFVYFSDTFLSLLIGFHISQLHHYRTYSIGVADFNGRDRFRYSIIFNDCVQTGIMTTLRLDEMFQWVGEISFDFASNISASGDVEHRTELEATLVESLSLIFVHLQYSYFHEFDMFIF